MKYGIDDMNLNHLEQCIMVDTLGVNVNDVETAGFGQSYALVSSDKAKVDQSTWTTASLTQDSGKRSIRVRGLKAKRQLHVEGSNGFHYQGHNIVTSSDVAMSAYSLLAAVQQEHRLDSLTVRHAKEFALGSGMQVTRVDTPLMLRLPVGLDKAQVINAVAVAGIAAGINIGLYLNETVYFDQHSQSEAAKLYNKAAEISAKKKRIALPETPNTQELLQLPETTLRFEPVFRKKYLDRRFEGKPVRPGDLPPRVLCSMVLDQLEKYNLRGSLRYRLTHEDLMKIPMTYRPTVEAWQRGANLRKLFAGHEATLSKHRGVLHECYSINIDAPPPGSIEIPVELGELLSAENFMPIPDAIRMDPLLFYERDMGAERRALHFRAPNGFGPGIGAAPLDPR